MKDRGLRRPPLPRGAADAAAVPVSASPQVGFNDVLQEFSQMQKKNAELLQTARLQSHLREAAERSLHRKQHENERLTAALLEKERSLSAAEKSLEILSGVREQLERDAEMSRTSLEKYAARISEQEAAQRRLRKAYVEKYREKVLELSAALRKPCDYLQRRFRFDGSALLDAAGDGDAADADFTLDDEEEELSDKADPEGAAADAKHGPSDDEAPPDGEGVEALEKALARAKNAKRVYYAKLVYLRDVLSADFAIDLFLDPYETDEEEGEGEGAEAADASATVTPAKATDA